MYFYVTTQCHNLPIRAASSLNLLAFLVELVVDGRPLSFNYNGQINSNETLKTFESNISKAFCGSKTMFPVLDFVQYTLSDTSTFVSKPKDL